MKMGSLHIWAAVLLVTNVILVHSLRAEENNEFDAALKKELGVAESATPGEKDEKKAPVSEKGENSEAVPERFQGDKDEPSVLWLMVKVILVLGILVGVMYYALKIISVQRDAKYPVKGVMNLLSSMPVGPNKYLQIVDVSGQLLVLGVSDNSINLITEIKSNDVREKIYHMKESFEPTEDNFIISLLNSLKKVHTKDSMSEADKPAYEDVRKRQLDRLNKLKLEKDTLSREMENPSLFWKS